MRSWSYREGDERGWVVCRVLAFLDSPVFDDVGRTKECCEHPATRWTTIETVSATYLHVIDELIEAPKVSAEEALRAARSRVSSEGVRKLCGELLVDKG